MQGITQRLMDFISTACLAVAFATPLSAEPVLDVDRLVNKTVIHPGQPVEVTLKLTGDHETKCTKTALVVVMDVSGSLANWHGEVTAAIVGSLPYIDFKTDMVAVAAFEDNYTELQGWTGSNAGTVISAFAKLQAGGNTNIPKAMRETNALLAAAPGNPDCRAALFVTDGIDSCPSPAEMNIPKSKGWSYAFLGVGNQYPPTLKCMAGGTGGVYYDTSMPPYKNAIDGAIRAVVDDFIHKALKVVAPSQIVVTEATNIDVTVLSVQAPKPPPNQADPVGFSASGAPQWDKLRTIGTATLPPIDRLDIGANGAVAEYSLQYSVTVNDCDPLKTLLKQIDGPSAKVSYHIDGAGPQTVTANALQIAVHPCSMQFDKTWNGEERKVTLKLTNFYPHTAMGIEVLDVLNSPLSILRAMPQPSSGGPGRKFAQFALPPLDSGASLEVNLWIAPSSPLLPSALAFPINNVRDSHFSFIVPWFASEILPSSPDYAALKTAIQKGKVDQTAKTALEKTAYAVPHAHNTEVVVGTSIAAAVPWPGFQWRVQGTTGDFLIKAEGSSYIIYVAHRQWQYDFPALLVDSKELTP